MSEKVFLHEVCPLMVETLQSGGSVPFTPAGNSMLPILRDRRDKIVLVKAPKKLKKYDIPLYRRDNGQFVLHRVVAIKKNGYTLCGDHQWQLEHGVRHEQVIGVVKGFYRGNKYIDCKTNLAYLFYCLIWTRLTPARRLFFKLKGWLMAWGSRFTQSRQIQAWLYRNIRPQILLIILLVLCNAAFVGFGVSFALISRTVIDSAVAGDKYAFITFTLLLFGVIILQLILRITCNNLQELIKARVEMGLKSQLLMTLLNKDYAALNNYHSGELLNHLTSDVFIISDGVTTIFPDLVSMLTRLLCAFMVLVAIDGGFALVFAVGGILLFLVVGGFRGMMKEMHKKVLETDGKLRSFMQEVLESLLVIKTFGAQSQVLHKTTSLQDLNYQAKMKRLKTSILANSGFSFIFQIGYLYALVWSAYNLYLHYISFGTLTAVLQLVGQVQTPFLGLSGMLPRFYGVLASAERIMELEKLRDETEGNNTGQLASELESSVASIVIENVHFRYDRETVLESASMRLDIGDFIMVAGASGIGKTTLLMLLLGVFFPEEGKIYLQLNNGNQIQADQHTRKLFAYVPQGNFILSGSIRENIAFIKPDASDIEIMEAARISCAAEFIEELPAGIDTLIGEKGLGLSEGQIQRLAIARAILSGRPILLLDESTSALDESTEYRLLHNLSSMNGKTCLIISHRQAPLSICNKELFIENKIIVTREVKRDERRTG